MPAYKELKMKFTVVRDFQPVLTPERNREILDFAEGSVEKGFDITVFNASEVAALAKFNQGIHDAKLEPVRPSNLVSHAETELKLWMGKVRGPGELDDAYDELIRDSLLELVYTFSTQGHSGFSAKVVMTMLSSLLEYDNLLPLTDNPNDWVDQTEASGRPMWQSKRNSKCFSNDGGKTYYNIEEPTWIERWLPGTGRLPMSWRFKGGKSEVNPMGFIKRGR